MINENNKSAFSGGTKVTFDADGVYSSGPRHTKTNSTNANNTNMNNSASSNNYKFNFNQNSSSSNYGNAYQQNNYPPNNNFSSTNSAFSNGGNFNNNINPNANQYKTPTSESFQKDVLEKKQNKKMIAYGFIGAAIAFVLFLGVFALLGGFKNVTLGSTSNVAIENADESETLAEEVSNKCLPSVVAINVYSVQRGQLALSSMGSGVVISNDGYIVTNQHVIDGASQIKVTIKGQEYDADKIGEDSSSDIAVIKAKGASNIVPIELGDSDAIKVGAWVMAIGSPFGLEQSVATGIVSAKSRSQVVASETDGSTKVYPNLIQTDAAINPGNSGGALVDKNGKLIGINALIESSSGNYSGVGFAIPVSYAIDLSKQIIEGKSPSHAQLGITMTNVDANNSKQYGWSVKEGAYVSGVTAGGPADMAGIKIGDIIIKCDDKKISTTSDLLLAVRSHNPGDTMDIKINRAGSEMEISVTLGSDEGQTQQKNNNQQQYNNQNNGNENNNGNGNGNGGNGGNGNSGNGYGNDFDDMDDFFKYFFGY